MNIDGSLGNKYQGPQITRPFDFGTDAIEKTRVSQGQSLIDADFEYGLQATKWQTYADIRRNPSFFEVPGTDYGFNLGNTTIVSDAGSPSTITVSNIFTQSGLPILGTPISIQGLGNNTNDYDKAQGFFVITSILSTGSFTPTANSQSAGTLTLSGFSGAPFNGPGFVVNLTGFVPNSLNGQYVTVTGTNSATSLSISSPAVTITTYGSVQFINFQYQAKGQVSKSAGTSQFTNYTIIRKAGFYSTSNVSPAYGNLKIPLSASPTSTGNVVTFTTTNNHGLIAGTPVVSIGWVPTGYNGSYIIGSTPSPTTFTYVTVGTNLGSVTTTGNTYTQTYASFVHRPYDGGVLISPVIPAYGASIARQSKKVFRYQSGKGLMWSSGTLFCPNNDILTLFANGVTVGSMITIGCSIPHGNPQPGATVIIKGIATPGYNGTYTVSNVIDEITIQVLATQQLGSVSPLFGDQPRFVMSNWHGASARVGTFDDQNGMFFEWDGQTLWVVKRSSTFQIAGTSYVNAYSQLVNGLGTRYSDQLKVGDKITLKGMSHVVTSITSQNTMTVNPPFRGAFGISSSSPATICKIRETRTPQSQFNRDTIDGNGPSGFKFDQTKMQMLGLQYTWYGAGFIDFMIRGSDGNWVYAHRYRQNNINDEAYMRTGNMSVRYELVVETSHAASLLSNTLGPYDTSITLSDPVTYWPSTGTIMIDNEFIGYTSKSGTNSLTGLTRTAPLNYNVVDTNRQLTAGTLSNLHTNTSNAIVYVVPSSFNVIQPVATGISIQNVTPTSFMTNIGVGGTLTLTGGIGTVTFTSATTYTGIFPVGSIVTLSGFLPLTTSNTRTLVNSSFTVLTCNTTAVTFSLGNTFDSFTQTTSGTVSGAGLGFITFSSGTAFPIGTTVSIPSTFTPSSAGIAGAYTVTASTPTSAVINMPGVVAYKATAFSTVFGQTATLSFSSFLGSTIIPVSNTVTLSGFTPSTLNTTFTVTNSSSTSVNFLVPSTGSYGTLSTGSVYTQISNVLFTAIDTNVVPFNSGTTMYITGATGQSTGLNLNTSFTVASSPAPTPTSAYFYLPTSGNYSATVTGGQASTFLPSSISAVVSAISMNGSTATVTYYNAITVGGTTSSNVITFQSTIAAPPFVVGSFVTITGITGTGAPPNGNFLVTACTTNNITINYSAPWTFTSGGTIYVGYATSSTYSQFIPGNLINVGAFLPNYTSTGSQVNTTFTVGANPTYNSLTFPITGNFTATSLGIISLYSVPSTGFLVSSTCVPSLTHWGSAFIMDGLFDQDRGYLFNYQTNNLAANIGSNVTQNVFCLRLSPTVSNGITADLGLKELLNRAQLLLQRLDLWAQTATLGLGSVIVSGILNPVFTSTSASNYPVNAGSWSWTPINNFANGSQPSFAQISTTVSNSNYTFVPGSGERVFSTISNAGSQNSIDLSGLKEICNGVIGGNNCFPDGPDTLLVQITNVGSTAITLYSLNLFWGEAQA